MKVWGKAVKLLKNSKYMGQRVGGVDGKPSKDKCTQAVTQAGGPLTPTEGERLISEHASGQAAPNGRKI